MISALPAELATHGIGGGSTDLPVPLAFAMVGASWARVKVDGHVDAVLAALDQLGN